MAGVAGRVLVYDSVQNSCSPCLGQFTTQWGEKDMKPRITNKCVQAVRSDMKET